MKRPFHPGDEVVVVGHLFLKIPNIDVVKRMDIIANISLNLYSFALLTNHLCFHPPGFHRDRTLLFPI